MEFIYPTVWSSDDAITRFSQRHAKFGIDTPRPEGGWGIHDNKQVDLGKTHRVGKGHKRAVTIDVSPTQVK
jgi:hypothetical protein